MSSMNLSKLENQFTNIKNADKIDFSKQGLMRELKYDFYNCNKFCFDLVKKYYNE